MTASVFLYSIAAVLITAALGAVGWLWRDHQRIRAAESEKDHRIAEAEETAQRILREKNAEEQIHRDRPDTVADARRLLQDL